MVMNKLVSEHKISYWVYELESDELPVLFVHGHGGDHRGLEPVAEELGATVYSPDLPGFGESEPLENHSIKELSDSLIQLIDELKLAQYAVVGHSLGSVVALSLAVDDPRVKKLILLNPVPQFSKIMEKLLLTVGGLTQKIPEPYAKRFIHAHIYNLAVFLIHSRNRRDKKHRKEYLQNQADSQYSLKAWYETGEDLFEFDQIAAAEKITVPTLLIHCDLDSMTSLEAIQEFQKAFSNASVQRVAHSGHFVHIEDTQTVAKIIDNFVGK